jgi:serine/threonine protein kinase
MPASCTELLALETAMAAKLVVVGGPAKGQSFALPNEGTVVIGRGDTATFRLVDPTVSRAHCQVEISGGRAVLRDAGSKTGTRVNGKPVPEHLLKHEDTFSIGTSQIRFEGEPDDTLPEPEEPVPEDDEATDPEELCVLANTTLGHFQVGAVVAVGNSGVVFKAHDVKEDREVALKVYLPEFARSEEDLQRFIRAVKTMLPMRHTNLVTLYGGGKTGPYCWMSMEFVEGESLAEMIKRIGSAGKLDWKPSLRAALHVARGLNYIHGENIVHRNLSPSNILFARSGGVAKLGSLILAKALSGAMAREITVGGEILGDIRYLSPEQAGGGGDVDARADIYSLGAVIYALLTGRPPFEGKTPLQTATMILEKEPIKPRTYDPTIPDVLEKIVLTALRKKAEDRYESAAEMLAALEELPRV